MNYQRYILVLVLIVFSFPARADDDFTVLYQRGSWTVFKFDGNKPGDPPSYCSAKSGNTNAFFELIGLKQVSCLNAEASKWSLRKRKAEGGFFVGGSGFYLDPVQYFSNGLQYCGSSEMVDIFIDSLANAGGQSIDIYDHKKRKIGSFPASGMKTVVRKWNTCKKSL